jgi:Trk-type K+ transport system membrane component
MTITMLFDKNIYTKALPILALLFLCIAEYFFIDHFPGLTHSELGLVENLQAILLMAICVFILYVLIIERKEPYLTKNNKLWFVLGLLGAVFVLVEETSYGQHYFNWDTPDYWRQYNDQHEINLHNTTSWLDQKPRLLLELGIILGGIIYPIVYRYNDKLTHRLPLQDRLPDVRLFWVALIAVVIRIYERLLQNLDAAEFIIFTRTSEVQELYFYYFLLLYFVFLWQKAKHQ